MGPSSAVLLALFTQFALRCYGNLEKEFVGGAFDSCAYMTKTATHPQELAEKLARDAKDMEKFHDKSQDPQQNFTWSEVGKFDGEDGRLLYLVFNREVYDVTDYADLHPAGPKPLKQYGGRDATIAMKASGMPAWVCDTFLRYFKVGKIASTESGSYENPDGD